MLRKRTWITFILGVFLSINGTIGIAQTGQHIRFAVDTLVSNSDTMILFSDKSWEYLSALNFDGVTNPELHNYVMSDSNYMFKQTWHNHMPYTYDNDLSAMKDSIWVCTVDSTYTDFCIPIEGAILSTFKYRGSRFHHGIDIDLNKGDTVRAAFAGRVRYSEYNNGGYGNLVIIRHYNGLETYNAHFSKLLVSPNQEVRAGQPIGLGGKTGRAYGDHLHFEVRFYDNALDPENIFDFKNKKLKDENLFVCKDLFDYKAISGKKRKPSSGSSHSHSEPAVASDGSVKYHKIRKDESLWSISRKYRTSIDALCDLNNINRNTILKIGRMLKVR
jgi:hypothetical protein